MLSFSSSSLSHSLTHRQTDKEQVRSASPPHSQQLTPVDPSPSHCSQADIIIHQINSTSLGCFQMSFSLLFKSMVFKLFWLFIWAVKKKREGETDTERERERETERERFKIFRYYQCIYFIHYKMYIEENFKVWDRAHICISLSLYIFKSNLLFIKLKLCSHYEAY